MFRGETRTGNMPTIESPQKTVERFIHTWRNTSSNRLREEIISTFNETNRKSDEYKYKFIDGELVDYLSEISIKIDTSTYIGQKDKELLDCLNLWVDENTEGTAIWISPSYENVYPCNKITAYQLETDGYGNKYTSNTTVLFDTPKEYTLKIASKLNSDFNQIEDPEVLRNKLFSVEESINIENLLELIGGNKNGNITTPSMVLVDHFVDMIHYGVDARLVAQEMNQRGLIGENSVSCGGSSKSLSLESNSLTIDIRNGLEDQYGSLDFPCPHCGAINTRPFGQLISNCQHCGGDVRC